MNQGVPSDTSQGYAPPVITQFSVFLDNRVGKLHELMHSFDKEPGCWVCGLSVHEASDHAVVRIITNVCDMARDILRIHSLPYSELDVLVVELGNDTHALSVLCKALLTAELSIRFAYPMLLNNPETGAASIALAVDDLTFAGQILRRKGYRLLGEADLPSPGSCW